MLDRRVAFGALMVLFTLCASCHKGKEPTDQVNHVVPASGGSQESEPKVIPLKEIWAYNMPGTLNVQKMDPDQPGGLFEEIRRSLWAFPSKDKDARKGFAVSGTGLEALRQVHAVLVEEQDPEQTFPANSDISVAFFSYQDSRYVHLHRVERQGNVVNIRYRFVPHETEEATTHFALIPLGKLSSGEYRVNVIQSPLEQKYVEQGFRSLSDTIARRIVCNSFSFSIGE